MSGISLAKSIDLQLTRSHLLSSELSAALERAGELHLASVTLWPAHVSIAKTILGSSDTRIRALIGAPSGTLTVRQIRWLIDDLTELGAHEIVVVPDHALLLEVSEISSAIGQLTELFEMMATSQLRSGSRRAHFTLVLNTHRFTDFQLEQLSTALDDSAVSFVQTGSGQESHIITSTQIRTLRSVLPAEIGIIASGGVATADDARDLINAGAARVSSAAALAIEL